MGIKVRMVPPDWVHPEDESLSEDFTQRHADWVETRDQFNNGMVRDWGSPLDKAWKPKDARNAGVSLEEWAGSEPIASEYMPEWPAEVATHFMMYETVTEGSPISPAFATPEELALWLVDNNASAFGREGATYEQWLSTILRGFAPSAIITNNKIESGVAALAELEPVV
jgi:hypothetical protein